MERQVKAEGAQIDKEKDEDIKENRTRKKERKDE
jgi:hypothetical protein